MSIGKNIKNLREDAGLTQTEFGKIAGVSDRAVSTWENDIKVPRMGALQKIADYFNVPKSFIIEEHGNLNILNEEELFKKIGAFTPKHLYKIPVYGRIKAGYPELAVEDMEGYELFDVEKPEEYICLRVNGDSMCNARIMDKDLVLVHKQNYAENGQIVACIVNGDEATLKRFREVGDNVMLQPENPAYEPIVVHKSQFDSGYARIIGVLDTMIVKFRR